MRTLATEPLTDEMNSPTDLTNRVVDGLEALRQRIAQRLRFPLGTWELDTRRGTESVLGHGMTPTLAAAVLTAAIQDEGGDEVTGVQDVLVNLEGRTLTYQVTILSIYGTTVMSGPVI